MTPQFRNLVLDQLPIVATGNPLQQKRPFVQIPNSAIANSGAEPMVQPAARDAKEAPRLSPKYRDPFSVNVATTFEDNLSNS